MLILLSNDDVESLLTMADCLQALEEAYTELAARRAQNRPRTDLYTPTARRDAYYVFKSMEGVIPSMGIAALRINSDHITWKPGPRGTIKETPEDAALDADILVAPTNAVAPVIQPERLRPGMHVPCVKEAELGSPVIQKSDVVIVHQRMGAPGSSSRRWEPESITSPGPAGSGGRFRRTGSSRTSTRDRRPSRAKMIFPRKSGHGFTAPISHALLA